jgi:CHAD domain-containing protein
MEEAIVNSENDHDVIHECRRTTKRIRSVLRLIRDEIGYSHYFRENGFYRDISRRMTELRDSYVLLQNVEMMEDKHPEVLKAIEYQVLKEELSGHLGAHMTFFMQSAGGFDAILLELDQGRDRIDQFCQLRNGFISIRRGIRRVYGKGRRSLSRIKDQFSMDEFHEYRKSTKYLHYQMELLQPVYPKLMKAYADTITKHAEHLGEARDCDRLEIYMKNIPRGMISATGKRKFLHIVTEHKASLMAKIYSRSDLIYAETAKKFTLRIKSYWTHHHRLT